MNDGSKRAVVKATDSCVLPYRPIQSAKSIYNFLVFVSVFYLKYAFCVKHSSFNLFFFQIFIFSTHFHESFFTINCCFTWFLYPLNSTISFAANIRTSGVRFSKKKTEADTTENDFFRCTIFRLVKPAFFRYNENFTQGRDFYVT